MEKTLKQDEIDALFEAARSSTPEAPRAEVRARVVPYNFSSAGQISNEQLRAISMLNDLFARNLTHNLAAWLRTRFQVNLVSAEQIQFNEFLLRIPEISYVASVRLEPLGALSVLQLDLALAPPMIDLLLGGEGRDGPLRELTDIEESILGSVVEIICRELTAAWQPVGLSFNFERRQMQTQVARIMSVTEKTLCLSFEIRMPHSSGLLNLAFPAVVANTILRRLTSDWGRSRRHAGETRARMEAAARRIRFGGSLQLPTVRLAASAIEESGAGHGSAPGSGRQHPARVAGGRPDACRGPGHPPGSAPRRAHRAPNRGGRAMKTYLDCWTGVAAALFSQALAGEPELVESLPKPLAAGSFGFAATLAGDEQGRFAVVLDGSILESPLVGEGDGPEGRLGRAAARGGRRRGRGTAGQNRQEVPRREVRADLRGEQGLPRLPTEVRRPLLDDSGARRGARFAARSSSRGKLAGRARPKSPLSAPAPP